MQRDSLAVRTSLWHRRRVRFAAWLIVVVSVTALACADVTPEEPGATAPDGSAGAHGCTGGRCDAGATQPPTASPPSEGARAGEAELRDASLGPSIPLPGDASTPIAPGPGATADAAQGPQLPQRLPQREAGTRQPPAIEAVVPNRAQPGARVMIHGFGFTAPLECRVAGVAADCDVINERRVAVQVPGSLSLGACSQQAQLELFGTSEGTTLRAELELARPAPALSLGEAAYPAQTFELIVLGLGPFTVTLGDHSIVSESSPTGNPFESTLTFEVPHAMEAGEHALTVQDQCASSSQPLTVLARPNIQAGPLTLAGGGVALLTVTDLPREDLLSIRVGGELLTPADASAVQWLSHWPGTSGSIPAGPLLALRMPSKLTAGISRLELITRRGSIEWPFEVVHPAGPYPRSPAGILGVSPAASGVFPISTIAAGGVVTDTESGASVSYDIEYRLTLRSAGREDCPVARAGKGQIYGEERVLNPQASHPVTGEYELHAQANFARITIDRSASGGVIEEYVGGWVRYPGADPHEVALPPLDERAAPPALQAGGALLLLISQRTGRQLLIKRDIDDEEEQTRVRGCMMELP